MGSQTVEDINDREKGKGNDYKKQWESDTIKDEIILYPR